ncbi:hypothetical protein HY388_01935 [Candidatus Daviesbacteria bacterium]|nr:hypothetical protein [Candidatus Daviesbacteria bacterium]
MAAWFKTILYFPIAYYFRFFAGIQLKIWHPRVIVVTGSSGKTTLLHLIESQLRSQAKYSHHANSSYGIPFDILNLHRRSLTIIEWPGLFLLAPFRAFKKPYPQKIYIVEADCDRPFEGKFLALLLRPEVTLWTSVSRTHSKNFDKLVKNKKYYSLEDAIAYEYGYFLEYTSDLSIVDGDSAFITKQLSRTTSQVKLATIANHLQDYQVSLSQTRFKIDDKLYTFNFSLPRETSYNIFMCLGLLAYLGHPVDDTFAHFYLPPGRSSVFPGVNDITIIDSSYNANLSSMEVILEMFSRIPAQTKWAVIGDMLEQGAGEGYEHEQLAQIIAKLELKKIILFGPRTSQYTFPQLQKMIGDKTDVQKFMNPREVLDYLQNTISGGEVILFKGARFLEGVIEHLLWDKNDAQKLARREKVWQIRRKHWGL